MIAGRYQPLDAAKPGAPVRARDHETANTVWLREITLPDDRFAPSLQRSKAAQGIFHPSLVTLFDARESEPRTLLLAHEFVQAQSLKQMSGGQPFHPRRAAELMAEVCDAVAELHARGVIHGGISIDTVLVTMKGKAKLDRVGDPAFVVADADEDTDIKAIIRVLRELTRGAKGTLPILETILENDDGAAMGSVATLAASLRAAAVRPNST